MYLSIIILYQIRDLVDSLDHDSCVSVLIRPLGTSSLIESQVEDRDLVSWLKGLDADLLVVPVAHPGGTGV